MDNDSYIWLDIESPINRLLRPKRPINFSTRTLEHLMQDLNVPGDHYKQIDMRNLVIASFCDCRHPSLEDWLWFIKWMATTLDITHLRIRNFSFIDPLGVKHTLRANKNKFHAKIWSASDMHGEGFKPHHEPCEGCGQSYRLAKDGFDAKGTQAIAEAVDVFEMEVRAHFEATRRAATMISLRRPAHIITEASIESESIVKDEVKGMPCCPSPGATSSIAVEIDSDETLSVVSNDDWQMELY